ncbi:peptidase family M28 [Aspergillus sclerotiicarbonarius CBS 121057]|uniref:Peptide hydrolase n=1 Tax=Aspergillus sclerotiicarbonarius (strain CBS 121057 / IBT 28362) TaxID=1448318 RepID=A0A319EHT7_ASPSB|nr:peptidase family M28 [Aspergillus sclerotiicarbonarius CBS 121057]
MLASTLLLLWGTAGAALASPHPHSESQVVFAPSPEAPTAKGQHEVDDAILSALNTHSDPVAALVSLRPEQAAFLAEPRLLHVRGEEKPEWMTEGDKIRLRRRGQKFMDITDHQEFYAEQATTASTSNPNLPDLAHKRLVKPLFAHIETQRMYDVLQHMTSYYNRYYGDFHGEMSAEWLHSHIAEIIAKSPFRTHISLEYFTHPFRQSSIIARFEPKVRNFSLPLTIIGAHQDSANYLFPLLPAPGADDDCSGTVSILEAFRVLAENGYTPKYGPVEFHWYAAEEGGLLGSQAVARYKKEQGAKIGAMMEFDMTAFIARNATETIGFVATQADAALTNWTVNLSREYISIPAEVYELGPDAGSDYMSYTQLNYPSAFASEGNPLAGGAFPGEFDPYVHGVKDTMDVDDETGVFSLDHMARFSELAIAFAVEQAGWDNTWR